MTSGSGLTAAGGTSWFFTDALAGADGTAAAPPSVPHDEVFVDPLRALDLRPRGQEAADVVAQVVGQVAPAVAAVAQRSVPGRVRQGGNTSPGRRPPGQRGAPTLAPGLARTTTATTAAASAPAAGLARSTKITGDPLSLAAPSLARRAVATNTAAYGPTSTGAYVPQGFQPGYSAGPKPAEYIPAPGLGQRPAPAQYRPAVPGHHAPPAARRPGAPVPAAPPGPQRRRSSALISLIFFVIILVIASGLGSRILQAISDLLNHR